MTKFKLKKDKFKNARGSYSRLLKLYCRKCNNFIAIYQKDGKGNLKRLYLDRIFAPENLVNLQKLKLNEIPILKCSKCNETLGTPYIYEKEKRKAFKLYQDSLIKKINKIG